MSPSYSIYLDLVRFFASSLVVLYHSQYIYKTGLLITDFGHEAVIVFFVLSGYVIAFVADTKENTLKSYALSRLARIYSVAIPAIVATVILDYAGNAIASAVYDGRFPNDFPVFRLFTSTLYLNEIWAISIQLFSNVPYWSINYEVWYYISFAVLTYFTGPKRWILFILAILLFGYKILLLMPIWWLGVYLYRSRAARSLSEPVAWLCLIISAIGIAAYIRFDIGGWGWNFTENLLGAEQARQTLAFTRQFLSDYYLGFFVALHFAAMSVLSSRVQGVLVLMEKPIRWLAGYTLAVYLLHQPLLNFFHAVLYTEEMNAMPYIAILALTFVVAMAIGHYTEKKKYVWKRWFTGLWDGTERFIDTKFGTLRGLVRLAISDVTRLVGLYRRYGKVDWNSVRRLVFVCQGNICRSPFAHKLAEQLIDKYPIVSIGLATTTGVSAFELARSTAENFSVDLREHRATDLSDFEILDGDLFLVMEDRHVHQLGPKLAGRNVQIVLLGLWCRPRFALLYDPYKLSAAYFQTCFDRIVRSVTRLAEQANGSSR